MFTFLLPLTVLFSLVASQINLGQFNLNRGPNGLLDIGFNQGGSILGWGGDRGFNAKIGEGVFGLTGNQGVMVGGQRVGTDSGVGVGGDGVNLGSSLNFGNGPTSTQPKGDFNSFLSGIGAFFNSLSSSPSPLVPPSPSPLLPPSPSTGPGLFVPPAPNMPVGTVPLETPWEMEDSLVEMSGGEGKGEGGKSDITPSSVL